MSVLPHILQLYSLLLFFPNSKLGDCLEDWSELTDDQIVESEPFCADEECFVGNNCSLELPGFVLPMKKGTSIHNWDYTVSYPYDAQLPDELTICPGDVITVEEGDNEEDSPWWMGTNEDGDKGYFYVKFTQRDTLCDALEDSSVLKTRVIPHSATFKETAYYVNEKPGEELECIICKNLADNPHQTECCGHTMCYNCADKWRRRNDSCPNCRLSPLDIVKDPRTKRYISSLTVYCIHYESGCEWKGSVSNVSNHLHTKCRYEIVSCKREGCGAQVQRQFLDNHMTTKCPMRQVQCPRCASAHEPALTYHGLVNNHYKHCPNWPMRCPNHCSTEVKLTRSTLQDHLENNCPEQVISCQFAEAGCTVRVKRKNMADHIQQFVTEHMTAMMSDYIKLKSDYKEIKKDHTELQADHIDLKKELYLLKGDHHSLMINHDVLKKNHSALIKDLSELRKEHAALANHHNVLVIDYEKLKKDYRPRNREQWGDIAVQGPRNTRSHW